MARAAYRDQIGQRFIADAAIGKMMYLGCPGEMTDLAKKQITSKHHLSLGFPFRREKIGFVVSPPSGGFLLLLLLRTQCPCKDFFLPLFLTQRRCGGFLLPLLFGVQ